MNRRHFTTMAAVLLSGLATPLRAQILADMLGMRGKTPFIAPVVDRIIGGELVLGEKSTILILGKNLHLVASIRFDTKEFSCRIVEQDSHHVVAQITCPDQYPNNSLGIFLTMSESSIIQSAYHAHLLISKPSIIVLANYDFDVYTFDTYNHNRKSYSCERESIPNGFRLDCYLTSTNDTGDNRLPGIGSELI